jgi:hypothetical protein
MDYCFFLPILFSYITLISYTWTIATIMCPRVQILNERIMVPKLRSGSEGR